ncbi:hypothetical protein ACWIUD_06530 [Helicobacter sp. 23-1044]
MRFGVKCAESSLRGSLSDSENNEAIHKSKINHPFPSLRDSATPNQNNPNHTDLKDRFA